MQTQALEAQLTLLKSVPWYNKIQIGLPYFKWFTLILGGLSILGLLIVHALVFADPNKYLPGPTNGNFPGDNIAIANFVLVGTLGIALVSAFYDTSAVFTMVQDSIKRLGAQSDFRNFTIQTAARPGVPQGTGFVGARYIGTGSGIGAQRVGLTPDSGASPANDLTRALARAASTSRSEIESPEELVREIAAEVKGGSYRRR